MGDSPITTSNHSTSSITAEIEKYLYYWKWFLASLLLTSLLGFIYLRYADKVYYTQAIILLQDEKKASGDLAGLGELAMLAGRTTSSAAYVNDQTQILQSRRIMRKVVNENNLHISYFMKGNFQSKEVIANQAPITLEILEPEHRRLDSIVYLLSLEKRGNNISLEDEFSGKRAYTLGTTIKSAIGPIQLLLNNIYDWEGTMQIQVIPREFAVNILRSQLDVSPNEKVQS